MNTVDINLNNIQMDLRNVGCDDEQEQFNLEQGSMVDFVNEYLGSKTERNFFNT
jgi:hypothetical protein